MDLTDRTDDETKNERMEEEHFNNSNDNLHGDQLTTSEQKIDLSIPSIDALIDPDKLILEMQWSFRDSILLNLSHLSAHLLHGNLVPGDSKMTLIKKLDDILIVLANLPLESDDLVVNQKDELKLEITREDKIKLINHLIKNKDFGILYYDSVGNELKKRLADENNRMITALLNLKVRFVPCAADKSLESVVQENDLLAERVELEARLIEQEEQMDELKTEMFDLRNEMFDLRNEAVYLKKELKSVEFLFRFRSLRLIAGENLQENSSKFVCQNICWYMSIESVDASKSKNESRTIGVYLCSANLLDDTSIEAKFQFSFLNQSNFRNNKVSSTIEHTFTAEDDCGTCDLISVNDLTDKANGFLKNSSIMLKVNLTVERISEHISD